MTFQELVEQYSDTDADTLDFIEAVLRWRRNVQESQVADVPRIWSGLKILLKREGEVSSVDKSQEVVGKEKTRLRRSKEAADAVVAKLQQEVNELQEEIEKSKLEKVELERQKQESKTWEEQKANLTKEINEMQRKAGETRKWVIDHQQGICKAWLEPDVKRNIRQIWEQLPTDSLEDFLAEK